MDYNGRWIENIFSDCPNQKEPEFGKDFQAISDQTHLTSQAQMVRNHTDGGRRKVEFMSITIERNQEEKESVKRLCPLFKINFVAFCLVKLKALQGYFGHFQNYKRYIFTFTFTLTKHYIYFIIYIINLHQTLYIFLSYIILIFCADLSRSFCYPITNTHVPYNSKIIILAVSQISNANFSWESHSFSFNFRPQISLLILNQNQSERKQRLSKETMEEINEGTGERRRRQHMVMLPFMAQGHLIPFLSLANKIQQRFGFEITIATTQLNVRYLQSAITKNSRPPRTGLPDIHLFELPFDSSRHGLPPNIENTESLPLDQIINLCHASISLETPFRSLISDMSMKDGSPPLCIISDVFMGWATEVARSCGTVNVTFTTGCAYGTAAYVSLWENLPHRTAQSDEFNLPGFPDSCRFHITQLHPFLRAADGTDSWSRFFQPQIRFSLNSFGWLCNSAEEIEQSGVDLFRRYSKLPVWCIGPLLPPAMLTRKPTRVIGQQTGRKPGVSPEKCMQWLDSKPDTSVLYVSFGSQNSISTSQMMALAAGLEESRRPFIWVIRPPVGFDLGGEFHSRWLPEGFEKRMKNSNQGMMVHGWAPQLEILCHRSTAAFVSHCGWNSTAESLSQGVPIIGWPLAAEQGYNAKMLVEEMGVCVELTRGTGGRLSKEDVVEVIETVMGEGMKAKDMRRRAGELGELIRSAVGEDGSSVQAMDTFVSALMSDDRSRPVEQVDSSS